MEKEVKILPSLLAADFLRLKTDLNSVIKLGLKSVHFDVMDGIFVPEISFGEKLFKQVYPNFHKKLRFDVHLMTEDPFRHIDQFLEIGEADFTFHYENTINKLKELKRLRLVHPECKYGLAFSPETDVSMVLGLTMLFDQILVMSVTPGAGGQAFIPKALEKIRRLDRYREENSLNFKIGVDGGIDDKTGPLCIQAGADYLVTGSYFFKAELRQEALDSLRR